MNRRARNRGLGDLPLELRSEHGRVAPGWHESISEQPRALNGARAGMFSPATAFITTVDSKLVLPLNVKRVYLLIFNPDAVLNLWVNLSAPARAGFCIKLPPGGNWEPWNAPINEIHVIGDAAAQTIIVVEGSRV